MSVATFESISKEIADKKFKNIYVLQGDEPYYIDEVAKLLEANVLSDAEKAFNQTIVYGKDTSAMSIAMAAKRYPMSPSDYQLIIVREAQNLKDIEDLAPYFEKPSSCTILCLALKGKKLDGRKKLSKLTKPFCLFNSEPLKEYQIPAWVEAYVRKQGKNIDSRANMLVTEYLGNDISKVANELDKMMINIGDANVITVKHIEDNIGISKDYNVFELQSAIANKNFNKAIQIAHYFAQDKKKNPLILTLASLNSFFTKVMLYQANQSKSSNELAQILGVRGDYQLKDYRFSAQNFSYEKVEEIFGLLKYFDLRGKGVDGSGDDEGNLLIELLVKIFK